MSVTFPSINHLNDNSLTHLHLSQLNPMVKFLQDTKKLIGLKILIFICSIYVNSYTLNFTYWTPSSDATAPYFEWISSDTLFN